MKKTGCQGKPALQKILMQRHTCVAKDQPVQIVWIVIQSLSDFPVGQRPGKISLNIVQIPVNDAPGIIAGLHGTGDFEQEILGYAGGFSPVIQPLFGELGYNLLKTRFQKDGVFQIQRRIQRGDV